MQLFEFTGLSERDQLDWIYQEGIYIGKRVKSGNTADIFTISGALEVQPL